MFGRGSAPAKEEQVDDDDVSLDSFGSAASSRSSGSSRSSRSSASSGTYETFRYHDAASESPDRPHGDANSVFDASHKSDALSTATPMVSNRMDPDLSRNGHANGHRNGMNPQIDTTTLKAQSQRQQKKASQKDFKRQHSGVSQSIWNASNAVVGTVDKTTRMTFNCIKRGIFNIPSKWPRIYSFIVGVVFPLWLLIGVSLLLGYYLSVAEAPEEITTNDSILAERASLMLNETIQNGGVISSIGILTGVDPITQPPTSTFSASPSQLPSASPSDMPSSLPSTAPSAVPTPLASSTPTSVPTSVPTSLFSASPTFNGTNITDVIGNFTDATGNTTDADNVTAGVEVDVEVDDQLRRQLHVQDQRRRRQQQHKRKVRHLQHRRNAHRASRKLGGFADDNVGSTGSLATSLGDYFEGSPVEIFDSVSQAFDALTFNWIRCWDEEKIDLFQVFRPTDEHIKFARYDSQLDYYITTWTNDHNQLYKRYVSDTPNADDDVKQLAFLRATAEASGSEGCSENFAGTAWFWFTIMTTVGYGNQAPVTSTGRAIVWTAGFFSILLFAGVLGFAGFIFSSIFEDIVTRGKSRLGFLANPSVGCIIWGAAWFSWMLVIAESIDRFWNERLGVEDFATQGEALWFAYISTTTVGLGDFYLDPEGIFLIDVLNYSLQFLVGFVLLSSFLGKFGGMLNGCAPNIGDRLPDSLANSYIFMCRLTDFGCKRNYGIRSEGEIKKDRRDRRLLYLERLVTDHTREDENGNTVEQPINPSYGNSRGDGNGAGGPNLLVQDTLGQTQPAKQISVAEIEDPKDPLDLRNEEVDEALRLEEIMLTKLLRTVQRKRRQRKRQQDIMHMMEEQRAKLESLKEKVRDMGRLDSHDEEMLNESLGDRLMAGDDDEDDNIDFLENQMNFARHLTSPLSEDGQSPSSKGVGQDVADPRRKSTKAPHPPE